MRRSLTFLPMAFFLFLVLTACSTLPLNGKLPDGLVVERLAVVDSGSPFALSPDGNVVAIVSNGLKLLHIPSRENIPLGDKIPLKLAWSPLGYSLAAIYAKDNGSDIVVFDQHGIPFAESPVDARLTDLAWLSEDELLAGGVRIKSYKFGSNYQSLYFRWKPGRDLPVENSLRDTTLQSATHAKWHKALERGPMLDLPMQSGTMLYLHPVDPPLFDPYYKVILRDVASGMELESVAVSLNSSGAGFSADGEKVLYADGSGATLLYDPWTEETLGRTATFGGNLSLSPEGEKWFADGTFFRKEGAAVPLAAGGEARFSRDGGKIVVRGGGELYLLTGLKAEEGVMFVPAVADKVAKLRSMRLQGLVTPMEYKESLRRITAP